NSLILWSADLEEPVHVDKYCSSLDVMPTLANLFGLEYDSRLMAGRDILSDTPGLVIFSNYSFLTDLGAYNSTTDVFTMWDGSEPDPDYVAERVAEVQNRVAYSASILDNDYYRVVFGDPEDVAIERLQGDNRSGSPLLIQLPLPKFNSIQSGTHSFKRLPQAFTVVFLG
ncbi:MAG: hypothetical protein ACLT5P_14790, partial [Flavonifractor plautii]